MAGSFCAHCGQRAIPAYPTLRELASDSFHEVSGWDGRFVSTFKTLIRKPGELTREFLIGHRARYISPIRLYLVTSLLYFLVAAAAPNVERNATAVDLGGGVRVGVFTPRQEGAAPALTPEEQKELRASIDSVPRVFRPVIERAAEDPEGFRRSMMTTLPRALFVLVPVFAGIMALFYRGRHYPEHLYFAFHLHAFIFLALTVSAVAKLSLLAPVVMIAQLGALIAIGIYATKATRHVYGGSLVRTLAKGIAVAFLYSIAAVPAFTVLLVWAALI
ncbi:MAG: DUF3667 domain-containing protein [Gemmatimonadaceae bacterium]